MYEYKVKEVVSIYDGDTMKVILDLGFDITAKLTLRLYGINAPEIRGEERPEGLNSRDWLRGVISHAQEQGAGIIVKTHKDKTGKYGRMLAEIFIDDMVVSVNRQMVMEGYAKEYML